MIEQVFIKGLSLGAIYAMIAIGFCLLWQSSRLVNFAEGEFVTIPAFLMLLFCTVLEFSGYAAPMKPLAEKYLKKYGDLPDHNFYKGSIGLQVVNAVVKETGVFDQQKFRDYLHKRTLCVKNHPGILMDVYYDENGDVDRESFPVKVENQKHVITGGLGPLNAEWSGVCKK